MRGAAWKSSQAYQDKSFSGRLSRPPNLNWTCKWPADALPKCWPMPVVVTCRAARSLPCCEQPSTSRDNYLPTVSVLDREHARIRSQRKTQSSVRNLSWHGRKGEAKLDITTGTLSSTTHDMGATSPPVDLLTLASVLSGGNNDMHSPVSTSAKACFISIIRLCGFTFLNLLLLPQNLLGSHTWKKKQEAWKKGK